MIIMTKLLNIYVLVVNFTDLDLIEITFASSIIYVNHSKELREIAVFDKKSYQNHT